MAEIESTEMPEDIEEATKSAEEQEQDSDSVSAMNGTEFNCTLCDERYKQPKVLSCLHIFCTDCIKKLLETSEDSKEEDAVVKSKAKLAITCPTCQQVTEASSVESLPTDHVTVNMLEVLAIKDKTVVCTSCKSQQPAVARCSDCANFLCPICVNAHQSMRCFENHKVVQFGEMEENATAVIHKPLFCPVHSTENMKYFCSTCQVPICNECMVSEHQQPTHYYSRMAAVEAAQIADMSELVKKCRGQLDECDEASQTLQGFLSELQMQRDNARGLIEETYQSYRAMMEKIKVQMLEKLEDMHSQQELKVMEMLHTVEKTAQRVEDGCAFGERLLKNGSPVEVLLLKRVVATQLQSLLGNVPCIADVGKIEFVTDEKLFSNTITATFGRLTAIEPGQQQRTAVSTYSQLQQQQQHTMSSSPSSHSHGAESSPTFSHEVAAAFGRDLQSPGSGSHHQQQSSIVTASDILANLPPLSLASLVNQGGVFSSLPLPLPELMSGLEGLGSVHGALPSVSSSATHPPLDMTSLGGGERSQSRGGGLHSPSNLLDPMPVGSGTAIVGRAAMGAFSDLQAALGSTSGLGLAHSTNGHHGGSLDLASLAQSLNSQMTPSISMPPLSSDASLASLLNSLSNNHAPNLNLNDLSNLLNSGTQSSTMSAMMEASNLLAQSAHGLADNSSGSRSLSPGISGNGFNQAAPMSVPFPARNAKKVHAMQIRCKFGQQGQGYGQFNSPHGFCLGMDDDIVVADTMNHRIEIFDKNGEHKYQFGIAGKEEGQLWYPRKVAVQRQTGKYIVCDRGNERSRMQIFLKNGHFVKKIAIRYIDIVAGIAISAQGHIVAVDSVTPTVFCISEAGDLIRWFDCSDYMREPSDIAICGKEYFVCDFKGHCVVVFSESGQFMRRIGSETITTFPNGIDVSDAGDILVGDSHGNRFHVAVFQRTGALVGEFECPYIKVSRCCGLKISSEGYIVTLAKNNHYVIVLNTLYIA